MTEAEAWANEERLWLEGAEAYRALLHPDCLMAFPGVGILRGEGILRSLEGAPRWSAVTTEERVLARQDEETLVLAYRATGSRAGAAPYKAWCTSTWRHAPAGWQMIQHQQTPT